MKKFFKALCYAISLCTLYGIIDNFCSFIYKVSYFEYLFQLNLVLGRSRLNADK